MKTTLILIVLIGLSSVGFSQTSLDKKALLTSKSWKMNKHLMAGMGIHIALPKDTEIKFLPNGFWVSSEQIEGTNEGTWELKGDNTLLLKYGNESKFRKAKLLLLNANELQYQINGAFAHYTFKWKAV